MSGIGAKTATIEWEYEGNKLIIDLEKDLEDANVLLAKIFSEPFSKAGAVDWLKRIQGIYPIIDSEVSFVDSAILDLSFDGAAAKRLREVSERRMGPFAYQVDTVQVGFPTGASAPRVEEANVCDSGKYRRQTIRLINMVDGSSIDVRASSIYACPPQLMYPDIQLNHDDAKRLFGDTVFQKYEQAIALIITEDRARFTALPASNKPPQPIPDATASNSLAVNPPW